MAANLLMIPIFSFYLMRDWDRLVAWIATLIPPRVLPRTRRFALEADEVLGSFIRGQLLVMAALATIYRSEEHTSELQSLMRISYAVFCLKKKNKTEKNKNITK